MPADGKELSENVCNRGACAGQTTQNFSALKSVHASNHSPHAIHHKLTIKTPRPAARKRPSKRHKQLNSGQQKKPASEFP
jgi:hypothetical protein